jgi:predicted AAA+ superfamily ATPase
MSIAYRRLFPPPGQSFFLLGARGTGKTTLLRATWPEATRIDLLDEARYQGYLANVGLFYEELSVLPRGARVIVDEIQRLPQLLNEVHRLIEERRLTFVLSGSSARKLRRAGVNLLAGRALHRVLHPFVPAELGGDFSLDRVLATGALPIVWDAAEPQETLRAYTQMYLKEEIQAEALVRNLPGFARFLPVAALAHGQVCNLASMARDAEVARTTVEGFFAVLEDTLLGFPLPAFSARLRVREQRKPKFYWIDPGLVRSLKGLSPTIAPEERGHLFEGWVAQVLRAYNDYRGLYDAIGYWSPAEAKQTAVDFVLQRGTERVAIEVKAASRVERRDFNGLRAIADLEGIRRRVVVYTGHTERRHEGIEIWPLTTFLQRLDEGGI